MTTDRQKFKKEMEASQYFMNKNAKSMFDVIDRCEYYEKQDNAIRQNNSEKEEGSFVNLLNKEMEELLKNFNSKEKQTLKLAQDLSDNLQYDIEDSSVVDTYDTALKLVNKFNYQKVPENKVVFDRDDWQHWVEDIAEQSKKEMTIKFYDKFNENISCFELDNNVSEDYKEGYVQAIADICGKLDETAVELGVDLKEYYGKIKKLKLKKWRKIYTKN